MRIIAGKYKGQEVGSPKGIRPTQDKVRKTLFDILGDIGGLSFLELFAGSGVIGLEAVSRGVTELTLVEYNRDCQLAIKKNIGALKVKSCNLYPCEAVKAIKDLGRENKKFDIIFLDPPYHKDMAKKALQTLGAYDILAADGLLVVEHFKKDSLPDSIGNLFILRRVRCSDTLLSIYKKN